MTEFVYFVECDPNVDGNQDQLKYVKIGKTNSLKALKNRMSSFMVGNPFKLNLLGYIIGNESELQNKFYDHLRRGEWFFLTDKIKKEIDNLNLIKPNEKYFNNFFYNNEIIFNFLDYKNQAIKKQEMIKRKQEQDKLNETKFKNSFIDPTIIEFFVAVLFDKNKNYNYFFTVNKKDRLFDLFNVLINTNEMYLKIESTKQQEIISLSIQSLEKIYKLFDVLYHNEWNYDHNLPSKLKEIQFNNMKVAIEKMTRGNNGERNIL